MTRYVTESHIVSRLVGLHLISQPPNPLMAGSAKRRIHLTSVNDVHCKIANEIQKTHSHYQRRAKLPMNTKLSSSVIKHMSIWISTILSVTEI